jgi:hypothetical protein
MIPRTLPPDARLPAFPGWHFDVLVALEYLSESRASATSGWATPSRWYDG